MSWYTDNQRHYPAKERQVMEVVDAGGGALRARDVAARIGWRYSLTTSWLSKLLHRRWLFKRWKRYGLTANGRDRLRFLRENQPITPEEPF